MPETRFCTHCSRDRGIDLFEVTSTGYLRRTCTPCRNQSRSNRERQDPKLKASRLESNRSFSKSKRKRAPHVYILYDCRASDRKKGLGENDLTVELICSVIAQGCQYCGETGLRMTLDRIDNDLPHNRSNVIPCCIRCNYLRGSMPHAAWLHIVPAVRSARENGLFGDWRSTPIRKKI